MSDLRPFKIRLSEDEATRWEEARRKLQFASVSDMVRYIIGEHVREHGEAARRRMELTR